MAMPHVTSLVTQREFVGCHVKPVLSSTIAMGVLWQSYYHSRTYICVGI